MVEYASVLINRYLVEKDGKTAYERLRGKKSKMLGFEFGASVHFRRVVLQGRLGNLDSPRQTGLFVGYRTQSGNSEGAYKTRTVKRIPEAERWDKIGIEGMPWTSWNFSDSAGSPGVADCAGPDSFLDIEIDKSSACQRHRANQYGILELCGMRQHYHWRIGNLPFRGVPPQDRERNEKRSRRA